MDWFRFELDLATKISERGVQQTLRRLRRIERHGGLDSQEAFIAFYLAQKRLGLTTASLNKFVQSLTHFCRYRGLQWELPKVKKEYAKRRQTYSDDEINQINALGVLPRENKTTHLVLELLAYTGARPTEICSLRQEQIDYQNQGVTIAGTKTGKDRFVPIPKTLINKLSALPDPLFTATDKTVREALQRRCASLSIPYRPPYCLRHSRISGWVTSGIDLPTIADLAGNSVNVITSNYWHTSVAHLQNAIKRDTLRRSQLMPEQKVREIAKLLEEIKNSFKLDEDEDLDVELVQRDGKVQFTVGVRKSTEQNHTKDQE